MESSRLLGVDAGSANTVAVLADISESSPTVIGLGMVPCDGIRRGILVDLDATARSIADAVAKALAMAGETGPVRAVISVSGSHVQSLVGVAAVHVHRPSAGVAPEDVRRALDAAAAAIPVPVGRHLIHVLPRAYELDGAGGVADPTGMAGRSLVAEALLVTAEEAPVQNALKAAARASLPIVDYQLALRAAGEAVLTAEERQHGVLLLDIGAGTTGVAVYDRGHLWHAAVLPVGSDHITTDIATVMRLPVAVAEEVKRSRGWAARDLCPDTVFEVATPSGNRVREISDREVAAVVESRVQEIISLAAAEVKRSGYEGLFPGGLVLTGGGSRLQGLTQTAADLLGLPSRIGVPEGALTAQPEFAAAHGLVIWGARLGGTEAVAATRERPIAQTAEKRGRFSNWLKGLFQPAPYKEET